jgi:hypothetical protein
MRTVCSGASTGTRKWATAAGRPSSGGLPPPWSITVCSSIPASYRARAARPEAVASRRLLAPPTLAAALLGLAPQAAPSPKPPPAPPPAAVELLKSSVRRTATTGRARRATRRPSPASGSPGLRDALASWREVSSPTSEYRVPDEVTGGVVLFDMDGDGDLDLFLVTGGTWPDLAPDAPFPGHALFRNDGGMKFTDVAKEAGVFGEAGSYCMGATAADFDGDGDQDLFVTGLERCWLYRNDGGGGGVPKFTECAGELGVRNDGKWATSACFLDADGDGRIDLYVANYLVFTVELNRRLRCGHGQRRAARLLRAEGVHRRPGRLLPSGGPGGRGRGREDDDACRLPRVRRRVGPRRAAAAREQREGARRGRERRRRRRRPRPLRRERRLPQPPLPEREQAGRMPLPRGRPRARLRAQRRRPRPGRDGVDAGDVDGDGDLDFVVTNLDLESNGLFRNDGSGFFSDEARAAGFVAADQGNVGFGVDLLDWDDDGDLDLIVANGHVLAHVHATRGTLFYEQADQLLENDGRGRFRCLPPAEAGAAFTVRHVARGLATGDLDGDGDLDAVIVPRDEAPMLLRNNHAAPRGDSLLLTLVGTKCNRDAIGARVTLTTGGKRQVGEVRAGSSYASRCDLRLHFGLGGPGGLGASARAEKIEVRWPGGEVAELGGAEAGFEYRIVQGGALEKLRALAAK